MKSEIDRSLASGLVKLLDSIMWTKTSSNNIMCTSCNALHPYHAHNCNLMQKYRLLSSFVPKEFQDMLLVLRKYESSLVICDFKICLLLGWMSDEEDNWYRLYSFERGIFYQSMCLELIYLKETMVPEKYASMFDTWMHQYALNRDRLPHMIIPSVFLPPVLQEYCENYEKERK